MVLSVMAVAPRRRVSSAYPKIGQPWCIGFGIVCFEAEHHRDRQLQGGRHSHFTFLLQGLATPVDLHNVGLPSSSAREIGLTWLTFTGPYTRVRVRPRPSPAT
jgi:hypothetical protein